MLLITILSNISKGLIRKCSLFLMCEFNISNDFIKSNSEYSGNFDKSYINNHSPKTLSDESYR